MSVGGIHTSVVSITIQADVLFVLIKELRSIIY